MIEVLWLVLHWKVLEGCFLASWLGMSAIVPMHVQPTCCFQAVSGCGFAKELPATDPSAGVGMCCAALHSSVVVPTSVGPPNWACGLLPTYCSKPVSLASRCVGASSDEPHGPSRLPVQPAGGWWCRVLATDAAEPSPVSGKGLSLPTCRPCTGSGGGQLSCHASLCCATCASLSCLLV